MRVFGNLLRHLSVPFVSVPAFGKHSGAAFGLGSLSTTALRAPNVAVDDELTDDFCTLAIRNVSQNLVELLCLRALARIVNDSSVLVQAAEVNSLDDVHDHERRF